MYLCESSWEYCVFFPLTHQVVVSETNSQHDLKAQTRETKHPLISQHARDLKLIWMLGAKKLKPQDPSPAITHLTLLVVALTPFNSWVAASNKDPVQTVKTTVAASANWVNRVRKVASEIDKFRTCRFLLVNSTWLRVGEVLGKSPKIILKFKDSTCFSNSGGVFNWSCWWFCWKLVEVMGRISLFSFGHSIPLWPHASNFWWPPSVLLWIKKSLGHHASNVFQKSKATKLCM